MAHILTLIGIAVFCLVLVISGSFAFRRNTASAASASQKPGTRCMAELPSAQSIELSAASSDKTREQLKERLAKLSKVPLRSQPPVCYGAPCMRTETYVFICPQCASRTNHTSQSSQKIDIQSCLRLEKKINGYAVVTAALDYRKMCGHCTPSLPKGTARTMDLVVRYLGDKTEHRTPGISDNDLRLLDDFLGGRAVSNQPVCLGAGTDVDRVRQLLGMEGK
jgi:hypothetical protein